MQALHYRIIIVVTMLAGLMQAWKGCRLMWLSSWKRHRGTALTSLGWR